MSERGLRRTTWRGWLWVRASSILKILVILFLTWWVAITWLHLPPPTSWLPGVAVAIVAQQAAFRLARHRERSAFRNALGLRSRRGGRIRVRSGDEGRVVVEVEADRLSGADLAGRNLAEASFWGADLRGADFSHAGLRQAWLRDAQAETASFHGADLRYALLERGNFQGADFRRADLRYASVQGADFQGAWYDRATRWPVGFRAARRGCVRVPDAAGSTAPLPIPAARGPAQPRDLPLASTPIEDHLPPALPSISEQITVNGSSG
jgi:hypothetical protein